MNFQNIFFIFHPLTWAWGLLACAWAILYLPVRADLRMKPVLVWVFVTSGFLALLGEVGWRTLAARQVPMVSMYESILWAAIGILLLTMFFQTRNRSYSVFRSALPVAITALILADLPIFDSAIRPLAPILRHPFWLVTHVATVTMSYAAFAMAMAMGHWTLWQYARGQQASLVYILDRSLQLGMGLLTAGILLGALWAQSAWGRFWSWDPKETWALISLLLYLGLLHGRLSGLWGVFGLAVGCILAFQAVLMTWYGVNCLLSKGLHSYGFGAGSFRYLLGFAVAECLLIGAACVSCRWNHSPKK